MSSGKPNGGGPNVGRSTSSAVKTVTPGSASAALVSIPLIFAWASSDRTNVIVAAPSRARFSTYVPLAAEEAIVLGPQHPVAEDAHGASL